MFSLGERGRRDGLVMSLERVKEFLQLSVCLTIRFSLLCSTFIVGALKNIKITYVACGAKHSAFISGIIIIAIIITYHNLIFAIRSRKTVYLW